MQNNWDIYEQLRDSGVSPHDVEKQAQCHGLNRFSLISMLCSVYSLDLVQAKEIMIRSEDAAPSLSDYQEQLIPGLEKALGQIEDETKT